MDEIGDGVAMVLQAGEVVAVCTARRAVFVRSIEALPFGHPDRRHAEVKALVAMTMLCTGLDRHDDAVAEDATRQLIDDEDAT